MNDDGVEMEASLLEFCGPKFLEKFKFTKTLVINSLFEGTISLREPFLVKDGGNVCA